MGINIELEEIISIMIQKFKPDFKQPEAVLMTQFDNSDDMYVVSKGACQVSIIDEKKNE